MIDSDNSNYTIVASSLFGFVKPSLPSIANIKTPIFVVRSGKDQMPNINETLDYFILKRLEENLPIKLINYPSGEHAFDLYNNTFISREIIKDLIEFYLLRLIAGFGDRAGIE